MALNFHYVSLFQMVKRQEYNYVEVVLNMVLVKLEEIMIFPLALFHGCA
jgi:hypothetical protein